MASRALQRGSSLKQRMMEAIRRHFREYGDGPSIGQLSIAVGASRGDVCRVLTRLEAGGQINRRAGQAHGVSLPSRTAMLSDTELEMEAIARGLTLIHPAPAVEALADAYQADPGTNCELPFASLLDQIDANEEGVTDDRAGRGEDE